MMHRLSLFLSLLTSATLSFAAATPAPPSAPLYKFDGPVNQGVYIVKCFDGADQNPVLSLISSLTGGPTGVKSQWDSSYFNGFAGTFSPDVISALQASPNVEYIEEDGIMSAFDIQNNAPWGLARISTREKLANQDPFALTYQYQYDSQPGSGVDIYVVDTGIYVEHPDFNGRAVWGGAFCDGCEEDDGDGHGTHVAGTAGSTSYGVAKDANLIAVKVLDDNGSGTVSGIINGLNWVDGERKQYGRPSIATMSLGGSNSRSLDDAVEKLISDGIHCTVAAGNSNEDARNTSPANTPGAIAVGATDITDSMAWYSNYGPTVSVFAPGSNVTSTWPGGGTNTISGTSMATPHVAGLVAYFLNILGTETSPAEMRDFIQGVSTKFALANVPTDTVNFLAYNDYQW